MDQHATRVLCGNRMLQNKRVYDYELNLLANEPERKMWRLLWDLHELQVESWVFEKDRAVLQINLSDGTHFVCTEIMELLRSSKSSWVGCENQDLDPWNCVVDLFRFHVQSHPFSRLPNEPNMNSYSIFRAQ